MLTWLTAPYVFKHQLITLLLSEKANRLDDPADCLQVYVPHKQESLLHRIEAFIWFPSKFCLGMILKYALTENKAIYSTTELIYITILKQNNYFSKISVSWLIFQPLQNLYHSRSGWCVFVVDCFFKIRIDYQSIFFHILIRWPSFIEAWLMYFI